MKKLSPCFIFLAALLGMTRLVSADAACEQSCYLTYDQCTQECGSGGTYWCFDACDQQRDTCLNNCQLCPFYRDYSTTSVLSRTYTNRNGCYQDHLYSGGRRYYEYYTSERRNNYRETTQCNGSKSTQLLSSSTYNYYCWVRGNTGADVCSNPAPNYLFLCH